MAVAVPAPTMDSSSRSFWEEERLVEDTLEQILPWLAVGGAWICFGSFAVPMKWRRVVRAEVHPMVYQFYKTFWTLVSSFLVLFFLPFEFSWWGLASGFSWVPAGVAAVIAVQNIGIAFGQATWQVMIIITSFVWGFFILRDEAVSNVWVTVLALLCLAAGVVGMTLAFNVGSSSGHSLPSFLGSEHHSSNGDSAPAAVGASPSQQQQPTSVVPTAPAPRLGTPAAEDPSSDALLSRQSSSGPRRGALWLGLGAAIFNGIWGGSNLVPSKLGRYKGVHFVFSFAVGAMVANIVILVLFVPWQLFWMRRPLPPPEFRVMALPGFLSGILWSAGNFCSLYCVETLGQGIGNALVQSSVIVSGLWGILWYRELKGRRQILCWCSFCSVCLVGVVLLALQRKPMKQPQATVSF